MTIFRTTILTLSYFVSLLTFGQKNNDTTKYAKFVALSEINRLETKYPDIHGASINGKTITDSIFKDKIVVINIWSKACMPCIAEIPGLDSLARQYKDKGVTFIAISNESDTYIKDKYISKDKFIYDHLIFSEDTVIYKYWGFGFPLNIVLDTKGIVKYCKYGGLPNSKGADLVYREIKEVIDKLKK